MIAPRILFRLRLRRSTGRLSAGKRRHRSVLAAVLFGLIMAAPGAQGAATAQGSYWVTDGPVYATHLTTDALYVGGSFSYIGPDTGAGTLVASVTATPETFPRINGQVHAAAPDGAGGWYVGGTFTVSSGSTSYANLVHVVPTTTSGQYQLDVTFDAGVDGDVTALVLSADGKTLYVGGSFANVAADTASPVPRNNIAAVDSASGAVDGTWNPDAGNKVDALVLSTDGSILYVGGAFTTFASTSASPVTRNHIAALKASDGSLTTWDPNADGEVKALALSTDQTLFTGGVLFAGGAFSAFSPGGNTANHARIAALSADTSQPVSVSTWAPDADGDVNALSVSSDNSHIYLGGAFLTVGTKPRQYLARVSTPTGTTSTAVVDDTWTLGTNGQVYTLQLLTNNIIVGGNFTLLGGQSRKYLGEVNINVVSVGSWNPSAEDVVHVVDSTAPGASAVFVGGDFISVGGAARNNLAALNVVSFQASDWDPDVDGTVRTIARSGGAVFIGGDFTSIGGIARNHFGAVSPSTGAVVPDWQMSVDQTVYALAVTGSTLYAGGAFTRVGTAPRNGLAAFSIPNTALTSWAPLLAGGQVRSVALSNDVPPVLYAGGDFTFAGDATAYRLAALDTKTGAAVWKDPMAGNAVMDMALSTDAAPRLYAGGDFTVAAAGGTPTCTDLAAFDAGKGTLLGCLSAPDAPVHALALAPDNVLMYIGGEFSTVAGSPHARVAALTVNDGGVGVTGWTPAPGPGGGNTVRSLEMASDHGTLYMGGDFKTISTLPRSGLAVFQPPVSDATPGAGAYSTGQNVQLSCKDKTGASCTDNILYSTDGTVPGPPAYGGEMINIPATATLKFFSTDSEGMREVINAYSYVIDGVAPTASASPRGGTYTDIQNVTLTCTDNTGGSGCADLYYTTDGSVPTLKSTKYAGAFPLSDNTVLKFIAVDGANNQSQVYQESYIIDSTAPTTTPSPAQGTYTTPQTVTLTCDDGTGFGCAATYYTLDGSVPSLSSPRYTQPLSISVNTTLNYFSVDKAGHQESPVSAVYLIQTGTVVTSGGGLFAPPGYLLGAWLAVLARRGYLRRRRRLTS